MTRIDPARNSVIRPSAASEGSHTFLGTLVKIGLVRTQLIETGLFTSTGHVAPVRFAFPLDARQFLLPEL